MESPKHSHYLCWCNLDSRDICILVVYTGKNTKPELLVRKFLFSRGFRYRLNHPRLPGHPDLVLRKYRTVIFVTRLKGIKAETRKNGKNWLLWVWHCITVWECQLKPKVRQKTLEALEYTLCHIFLEDRRVKPYETPEEDLSMVAESAIEYGNKLEKVFLLIKISDFK